MEVVTAVRAAALAVGNRDKTGKIIGIIVLIILAPVVLIVMLFFSMMSAFSPDGVLKSANYFEGADSSIYESVKVVLDAYYEDLKSDMAERKKEIEKNNTYEYEVTLPNGDKDTVKELPVVTKRIHPIPQSLIIAYLMMMDGIDVESAVIDTKMARAFIDTISSVVEIDLQNNNFLIENQLMSASEIADNYFPNQQDKTRFLIMCNAYGEYFDVESTKIVDDGGSETVEGIFNANYSSVPLYLQYDPTWGSVAYGNGTIKKNGCCPTCLAMVFSYFRQETIYPTDIVAWSGNKYYVNGAGTAWSIFVPAAQNWGITCTNIGKSESAIVTALSSGKLVIASMGPGTFTKGGHFIVLTGIAENKKIRVNDPNDNGVKRHSQQEFDISLILRESKNMWAFGK